MNAHIYFFIGLVSGLAISGSVGVYFYHRLDAEWSKVSANFNLCQAYITLERLRSGKSEDAIKFNEHLLDAGVMDLARVLRKIPPQRRGTNNVHLLRKAKDYRARFPYTGGIPEVDMAVARALALADEWPNTY